MVNQYWLEQVQRKQQKAIEAQLKSGKVIIQDGKIILNEPFKKSERVQRQIQKLQAKWAKQREKHQDQIWQRKWAKIEKCLKDLWSDK